MNALVAGLVGCLATASLGVAMQRISWQRQLTAGLLMSAAIITAARVLS